MGGAGGVDQAALPKAGKGRRPRGLGAMLRIYFVQQWFATYDPDMKGALCDVPCM